MVRLQTEAIHGLDHRFNQIAECLRHVPDLFIVRLLAEIVVHISYQMDQALLLRALD